MGERIATGFAVCGFVGYYDFNNSKFYRCYLLGVGFVNKKCEVCGEEIDLMNEDWITPVTDKYLCRDCMDTVKDELIALGEVRK